MAENTATPSTEPTYWERLKEKGEQNKERLKEFGEKLEKSNTALWKSIQKDGFFQTAGNAALGTSEVLKELMKKFFSSIKNTMKKISKIITDNKSLARKLGVLQEELENLENIVQNNSDMSDERMTAMIDCLSRLNDRIADFSPDNVDKFLEDVHKNIDDIYDTFSETFVLRTNQIEEALDATIPKDYQLNYQAFAVKDKETGKMRAVLAAGSDSNMFAYEMVREGNFFKFVQLEDSEKERLAWGSETSVSGKTFAESAKKAYEMCYGSNKTAAEIKAETLQRMSDVVKAATESPIVHDGYTFQYDADQKAFFCEKEDGSKLTLLATPTSLTGYYQQSAEEESKPIFTINRTEENGKIKNECTFNVSNSLTEKVNELLNVSEVNAILCAYHGEELPKDLMQNNNILKQPENSLIRFLNFNKILEEKLSEKNNIKVRIVESQDRRRTELSLRGSQEKYTLTFTPDGKHVGYNFVDKNGDSAIISPTGGVIDSVIANNESFQKLSAIVQDAMREVNREIAALQNLEGQAREQLTDEEKQLLQSERFKTPVFQVTNGEFALSRANRVKEFNIDYTEEVLRQKIGNESFDKAMEGIQAVIHQTEALTTSSDGEIDGYYKELRAMPDDSKQDLAESIGKSINQTKKYFHPFQQDGLNMEETRTMVHLAFQQFSENNKPHQITTETIERAFATAYAEIVSTPNNGKQKSNLETGTSILAEIITEQNLLNNEHYNNIIYPEDYDGFIPEEAMFPTEEEINYENEMSFSSPVLDEVQCSNVYWHLVNAIAEHRLITEAPVTEMERKMLETMEKEGFIHEENGIYQINANISDISLKANETLDNFWNEFRNVPLNPDFSSQELANLNLIFNRLYDEFQDAVTAKEMGEPIENTAFGKNVADFLMRIHENVPIEELANRFANEYARSEIGFNILSVHTRNILDRNEFENYSAFESPVPEAPVLVPDELSAQYAKAMMEIKMNSPEISKDEMDYQMAASGWGEYAFNVSIFNKVEEFAEEHKMKSVQIDNDNTIPYIFEKGKMYDMTIPKVRSSILNEFMKQEGFIIEKPVPTVEKASESVHEQTIAVPEPPVEMQIDAEQPVQQQEPVQNEDDRTEITAERYAKLKEYITEGAKIMLAAASSSNDFTGREIGKAGYYLQENYSGLYQSLKPVNAEMLETILEEMQNVIQDPRSAATEELDGIITKRTYTEDALKAIENVADKYLSENYKTAEEPEKKTTEYPEMS